MKKNMLRKSILLIVALSLIFVLFTGCLADNSAAKIVADKNEAIEGNETPQEESADVQENTENIEKDNEPVKNDADEVSFGAKGAREDDDITIEEMLKYAIEDEFLARQEYESIMETFGEQRPFNNIINAEEMHISLLKELYEKYGYDIPDDDAINHVVIPDSIEMAFEIGVQAEIDNIAMYEYFLEQDLPDDIKDVFIELRDGSKSHLSAFQRGTSRGGNGNGNR